MGGLYTKANTEFDSRPLKARAKLAFFELGPLQLELMDKKIEKFQSKGIEVVQKGCSKGENTHMWILWNY